MEGREMNLFAKIRAFLFERMYRAPSVMTVRSEVTSVVEGLFDAYMRDPTLLPAQWQAEAGLSEQASRARRVADYIAGMTDRYALQAHDALFGTREAARDRTG